MVLTFINMEVQLEKHKELRQTIRSLVEQVRMETGCVDSNYYQNVENQNIGWKNRIMPRIGSAGVRFHGNLQKGG